MTDWISMIRNMKDGQKAILTQVESVAFIRACRTSGFGGKSEKIKTSNKYRVSVHKNENDKSWMTYRHNREMGSGNWNVDITKLPIPQSAYPSDSATSPRISSRGK